MPHETAAQVTSPRRAAARTNAFRMSVGQRLIRVATIGLGAVLIMQILSATGLIPIAFETWLPTLIAYIVWSAALGVSQVLTRGEHGKRALFLMPALLFTVAMVIFPTFFGLGIAATDWNLSSLTGVHFSLLGNLTDMVRDAFFWNALGNMGFYVASVLVQYAIAFGLALLLNTDIRGRRFFRVVFLLPFMLSPVAISWMIGKSILEARFGPAAALGRMLGWDTPAFFGSSWVARASIMAMDSWQWIPFVMVLLLAGLQALPGEVIESAKVDGANSWQSFWKITFPLMLPVSVTAVVLRIIFELKLADLVINVTGGGPGGATDTVSSFIYREYRDRASVGYGTMLAEFYLILIILFVTALLAVASRWMRRLT